MPSAGRFTQQDPIGLAGGLNLYGFAGGDPVNFADPFGLCRKRSGLLSVLNLLTRSCTSADEAARRGLQSVYRRSVDENVEYGGEIVSTGNGRFRYTSPRRGTVDGVGINTNVPGYEGFYHSHGATDPNYDSENFSNNDREIGDDTQKPAYMVAPSGRMRKYEPVQNQPLQGTETEIGVANP